MRSNQVPANRRITRGSTKQQRMQQQGKQSQHTSKLFNPGLDSLRDHPSETNLSAFCSSIKNNSSHKSRRFKAKIDDELAQLMQQVSSEGSSVDCDADKESLRQDVVMANSMQPMGSQALRLTKQKSSNSTVNSKVVLGSANKTSLLDSFTSPNKQGLHSRQGLEISDQKRMRSNSSRGTVILPFCSPKQLPGKLLPLAATPEGSQGRKAISLSFCGGNLPQSKPLVTQDGQRQLTQNAQGISGDSHQARMTREALAGKQNAFNLGSQANTQMGVTDQEMHDHQQQMQPTIQKSVNNESESTEAFSSFLRAIAKLRLTCIDASLNDSKITTKQRRSLLHRTVALDFLKGKTIRRHQYKTLIEESANELVQNAVNSQKAKGGQAEPTLNQEVEQRENRRQEGGLLELTAQQEQLLVNQNFAGLDEAMAQGMTREQANGYENIKELILIGQYILQMQEDALHIIDKICLYVNLEPVKLIPILQQQSISLQELDSVKEQLIQQHLQQFQQIELRTNQLISSHKNGKLITSAFPPMNDEEREQSRAQCIQMYNALLQMAKQLTTLFTKMNEVCPELQNTILENNIVTPAPTNQVTEHEQQQQIMTNEIPVDQQQLALEAEQELLNQAILKERLQELVTNPDALALGSDINDPETLLKIRDLRSVLEQLVIQQESPSQVEQVQPDATVTNEQMVQEQQVFVQEQQQQQQQQQPQALVSSQEEAKLTNDNLNQAADLLQQRDEIQAILQLQQQLNSILGAGQNPNESQQQNGLTNENGQANQGSDQANADRAEQQQTFEVVQQLTQLLQLQIQQEQEAGGDLQNPEQISAKAQGMLQEFIQYATSGQQPIEALASQQNHHQATSAPEMCNEQNQQKNEQAAQAQQSLNEQMDLENKLQIIIEMLQLYAQDDNIKERLDQIKTLQAVLKNGTPEQKLQAQNQIIEYVETLQTLDFNGVQAQEEPNQQLQQQPQTQISDPGQQIETWLLKLNQTQNEIERLQFLQEQSKQEGQQNATISAEQQERELQILTYQCQQQMLCQLINQVSAGQTDSAQLGLDTNNVEQISMQQQSTEQMLHMQLQMLLQEQQNQVGAVTTSEQLAQAQAPNSQFNAGTAQIQQSSDTPREKPDQVNDPSQVNNGLSIDNQQQPSQQQQDTQQVSQGDNQGELAQIAMSYQAHLDDLHQRLAFAQLSQVQQAQAEQDLNHVNNSLKDLTTQELKDLNQQFSQQVQLQQSFQQQQQVNTTNNGSDQNATNNAIQHPPAEPHHQLTEEQRLQILQSLSLNIQEQDQVKQVLQESQDNLQSMQPIDQHQLLQMYQHLQQLEMMAVQMQSMIQPTNSNQVAGQVSQLVEAGQNTQQPNVINQVNNAQSAEEASLIKNATANMAAALGQAQPTQQQVATDNLMQQQAQAQQQSLAQIQMSTQQQQQPQLMHQNSQQQQLMQANADCQQQQLSLAQQMQSAPEFQKPTLEQIPIFSDLQQQQASAFFSQTPQTQQLPPLHQQQQQILQTPTAGHKVPAKSQHFSSSPPAQQQHVNTTDAPNAMNQQQQPQQVSQVSQLQMAPVSQNQSLNRRCLNHLFLAHMIQQHQSAGVVEGVSCLQQPQLVQQSSATAPNLNDPNCGFDPAAIAAAQQQVMAAQQPGQLQQQVQQQASFQQQQEYAMALDQQQQMIHIQQMDSRRKKHQVQQP